MNSQYKQYQNTLQNPEPSEKRTVYVDLDGVLCAFDNGFYNLTGLTTRQVTDSELWARIDAHGKSKFFSELEWEPGGRDMWKFIIDNFLQVKILSSLGKSDIIDKQTTRGKMEWLKKNIPTLSSEDIILVQNKHKKKQYSKPGDIMIDDTLVVIQEWIQKGGIGILHKTAMETINKLKQYI